MMIRYNLNEKDIAITKKKVQTIDTNEEKVMHLLERFFSIESQTWLQFKSYLDLLVAEKKQVGQLIPAANMLITSGLEQLRPILEQYGVEQIVADISAKDDNTLSIILTVSFDNGKEMTLGIL